MKRLGMGKSLVVIGLVIAGLGLLIMLGLPLGRLPGDIAVRRGNFSFYFPLATSILLSVLLTLLFALFRR
jgi:predicted MFS family arabinose efflux permease